MEVCGQPVVTSGDTSEILEPVEHAPDGVAVSIKVWQETVFPDAVDLGRDVWRGSNRVDLPAHGVGVVALVAMDQIGGGDFVEQGVGGDAIRDLPAGEQEGDGAAVPVGQGVDFGGATAARATDRLVPLPPFPPEAQRCTFTAEESIKTSAGGPPAVARA